MVDSTSLQMTLLPGARALLAAHARELPQRDDLCGAFCGALAFGAAALGDREGGEIDQDAVALAAGSVVSAVAVPAHLPHGESGRRDYRLPIPAVADAAVSGTTAAGLRDAIEQLGGGQLSAIPYAGPWTARTLDGLFDLAAVLQRPVALIANLATRHLWGTHPRVDQLLGHLHDGALGGPPPDWDVGHFVCIVGRLSGPGGSLYAVADTYPALGAGGVHLQPRERLAAAIERRDMPAGGVLAVVADADAAQLRSDAGALGLVEGVWDNGTATPAAPR
jgi:hypothetical protein